MTPAEAITDRIVDWTGEGVIVRHDRPTGAWIFIALHDFTLGRPSGGTRMRVYPELADAVTDAVRLAEGMTSKWAAIDFDYGGGKCVIAVPGPIEGEARVALLERYGRFLASLGGAFTTGVDLGVTPEDMAVVARHCSWVHGIDDDGSPIDPGPFTGRGVYVGLRRALEAAYGSPDPAGRRVVIQGLGDVGWVLAAHLAEAGAEIVASDLRDELVERAVNELGATAVAAEAVYDAECDVYAPCAIGATVNAETIPRLRCRVVAGSANNQLALPEDAERLHGRGILYAPDYVINAGGAKAFALIGRGERDREELFRQVEQIGDSLGEIFAEARERDESPFHAARRRVERILERGPRS